MRLLYPDDPLDQRLPGDGQVSDRKELSAETLVEALEHVAQQNA